MPKDEFDKDDPMELVGVIAPPLTEESVEEMTESLVDEYVRMGWEDEAILALFRSPYYQMTHAIYRQRGEPFVRALIEKVRRQWGNIWSFRSELAPDENVFVPIERIRRM